MNWIDEIALNLYWKLRDCAIFSLSFFVGIRREVTDLYGHWRKYRLSLLWMLSDVRREDFFLFLSDVFTFLVSDFAVWGVCSFLKFLLFLSFSRRFWLLFRVLFPESVIVLLSSDLSVIWNGVLNLPMFFYWFRGCWRCQLLDKPSFVVLRSFLIWRKTRSSEMALRPFFEKQLWNVLAWCLLTLGSNYDGVLMWLFLLKSYVTNWLIFIIFSVLLILIVSCCFNW